jgi:hypothetical protein
MTWWHGEQLSFSYPDRSQGKTFGALMIWSPMASPCAIDSRVGKGKNLYGKLLASTAIR